MLAPNVGGFAPGLRARPHLLLSVLAAHPVGRPVKLVLTRSQMLDSIINRAEALQRVKLGATASRCFSWLAPTKTKVLSSAATVTRRLSQCA